MNGKNASQPYLDVMAKPILRTKMYYEYWYIGDFIPTEEQPEFAMLRKPTARGLTPCTKSKLDVETLHRALDKCLRQPTAKEEVPLWLEENGMLLDGDVLKLNLGRMSAVACEVVSFLCHAQPYRLIDTIGHFRDPTSLGHESTRDS